MMDATEANIRGLGAARGLLIALPLCIALWTIVILLWVLL